MGNVIVCKRKRRRQREEVGIPPSEEKKICLREGDHLSSREEGERSWRKHPIVIIFGIRDVRNVIAQFTGSWSYFPMLYLGMTEVKNKDIDFYTIHLGDHFSHNVVHEDDIENCKEKVPTLSLLRWHYELLSSAKILTFIPNGYRSYLSHITPYEVDSSRDDLSWYFEWRGVSSWKGYNETKQAVGGRRTVSGPDEYDALIMSVEYGLMSMQDVPRSHVTITRPILAGRWDIAGEYVERGDAFRSPAQVLADLSPDYLDILLPKHDMYTEFFDVEFDVALIRVESLLRGGILPYRILEKHREYNIMTDTLSSTLPRVPMNVVEDLFTIVLFRANVFQRIGAVHVSNSILHMKTWFFKELKDEKRPMPPSSTHRMFKYVYVDLIIATVRTNVEAAELMLGAFIHARDVSTFLQEKEMMPSCL